jgi:hypothetical protein
MFSSGILGKKHFHSSHLGSSIKKLVREHVLEVVCAIILLVAGAYLLTVGVQLTSGVSMTVPTPDHVIRLQVVDGTGDGEMLDEVTARLAGYEDTDIEIEIAGKERLKLGEVEETVLISRDKDLTATRHLAAKLGMATDAVFYKPLEYNRDQVTATLILGLDRPDLVATLLATEETNRNR